MHRWKTVKLQAVVLNCTQRTVLKGCLGGIAKVVVLDGRRDSSDVLTLREMQKYLVWRPSYWVGWFFCSRYSQSHCTSFEFIQQVSYYSQTQNRRWTQELKSYQIKDATQPQFSSLCLFSLSYTISQLQASPSRESQFHSVTYVEGLSEQFNRIRVQSDPIHTWLLTHSA